MRNIESPKYSGTEMEWEGNEYLLVKSEDIQAKIK